MLYTQDSFGQHKMLSGDKNAMGLTGSFHAGNFNDSTGFIAPEPGQSFHVMSSFENEAQAIAYVRELQSYYDSQNLEVKVQIDTHLGDLDDTGEFASTKQAGSILDPGSTIDSK